MSAPKPFSSEPGRVPRYEQPHAYEHVAVTTIDGSQIVEYGYCGYCGYQWEHLLHEEHQDRIV